MPELPEVETTRRGILPHLLGNTIVEVIVRQATLRYPIPELNSVLQGREISAVVRRAKYLLVDIEGGHLMIHLGMSGSLRLVDSDEPVQKHDHVDWVLDTGKSLRYTDPRRFGIIDWITGDPLEHRLLCNLGPEPLADGFTARLLYRRGQNRKIPVKSLIMDSHVVVGVGNIYANEALFMAGVHPARSAGKISLKRYIRLVDAIKQVLAAAVEQGGTTLRDFVGSDGKPGYFKQSLQVYGRRGQPCIRCKSELKEIRQAQRSSVFCPRCQR